MNRTQMGLLARGLDLHTAERLADLGCTIGALKAMGDDELRALGIDDAHFAGLRSGGRPRICADVVAKLLFDNRFTCCVCREPDRDVILHHIREWSSTRDDDPANLAVLCLEHHGKAHTRSMMTRNLDPAAISVAKAEWERSCREKDLSAILEATRMSYDAWLYFNHQRLFELANHSGVRLTGLAGFGWAHRHSLVDGDGVLAPRNRSLSWMYEGGEGSGLYAYVRDVLLATLERLRVVNFSDLLERSVATALLAPGDFLIIQGAHRFRRLTDRESGPGELMRGSRRANDVDIRYTFDRWEATSGSAWATWLTGRQSVASLVQVKSVTREDGAVVVSGTVIAISNGLDQLQKRDYSPRYRRFMSWGMENDATAFDD